MQNDNQHPDTSGPPGPESFHIVPEYKAESGQDGESRTLELKAGDVVNESWQGAWHLFRADPVALPIAGFTVAVLGSLTFGILLGPLAWGLFAMCWNRSRAEIPMRAGGVFSEFERVGTSIGIGLLSGLAILAGYILLIIPGLYLTVALMYALPIGLDERRGATEAMRESISRVHASGFWPHAALAATLAAMSWVLSMLLEWAGGLIALAIALPVVACAYDKFVRAQPLPRK